MPTTDFVVMLRQSNKCLLIEQGARFVTCTEAIIMDSKRRQRRETCNRTTCLVSDTVTVMAPRALQALTVSVDPPGTLPTLPMGWCTPAALLLARVVGWALAGRLCPHPPREPPTLPALRSHQPPLCSDSFGRWESGEKVTLKNGHLEFDQVCSRYWMS